MCVCIAISSSQTSHWQGCERERAIFTALVLPGEGGEKKGGEDRSRALQEKKGRLSPNSHTAENEGGGAGA